MTGYAYISVLGKYPAWRSISLSTIPRQLKSSTIWLLPECRTLTGSSRLSSHGRINTFCCCNNTLPIGQYQADSGPVCHHFLGKSMGTGKSFVDVGCSEVLG